MVKPNSKSTLKEIRAYVREKRLNKPEIKLTMNKPELVAGLKKHGHWDHKGDAKEKLKVGGKKPPMTKKPKATPSASPKAKEVKDDKNIDFYEITGKGVLSGGDARDEIKKEFKPAKGSWYDSAADGRSTGLSGNLTKSQAKQIKQKFKDITIKRVILDAIDKPPYYKLVSV